MTEPPAAELPFDPPALWSRVAALLDAGKTLQARTELLSTWREHRHSYLAQLIEACDVRLRRTRAATWSPLDTKEGRGDTYVFSHDWHEWFTRAPDVVADRLAIYEVHPDPSATRIILELLLVAPIQLLIAERLWSVVERVLIALADVRAVPSLLRLVQPGWPPDRPHLAIQSVPHLEFAIARLSRRSKRELRRRSSNASPPGLTSPRVSFSLTGSWSEVTLAVRC